MWFCRIGNTGQCPVAPIHHREPAVVLSSSSKASEGFWLIPQKARYQRIHKQDIKPKITLSPFVPTKPVLDMYNVIYSSPLWYLMWSFPEYCQLKSKLRLSTEWQTIFYGTALNFKRFRHTYPSILNRFFKTFDYICPEKLRRNVEQISTIAARCKYATSMR